MPRRFSEACGPPVSDGRGEGHDRPIASEGGQGAPCAPASVTGRAGPGTSRFPSRAGLKWGREGAFPSGSSSSWRSVRRKGPGSPK